MIKRNIRVADSKTRERAYKSLVRPQLEYASPVWSPWQTKHQQSMEKVQRRAARYVCRNYGRKSSVTAMTKALGWETLQLRRAKARVVLFYKVIHNLVAVPFGTYCSLAPPGGQRTRATHSLKVDLPHCSKSTYANSFFPATARHWNALPGEMVTAPLGDFKTLLGMMPAF